MTPLLDHAAGRFADLLEGEPEAEKLAALRAAEGTGRPLGSDHRPAVVARLKADADDDVDELADA